MRGILKRTSQAGWEMDKRTQWGMFSGEHWHDIKYANAPVDVHHAYERGISFGREGSRYTTYLWEVKV